MSDLSPRSPIKAYHRLIRKLLDSSFGGKVEHIKSEYDLMARVFNRAGGSWERLFKGNVDDLLLLRKILKYAMKHGYLTKKSNWVTDEKQ